MNAAAKDADMHILITDSGVGGLSVVAYAERFVREHGFAEPVRLTFANAAPENDFGYNSMKTKEEKIATFDRFLRNVTERFAPDAIYVACNTLSVLLHETPFATGATIPVSGIVETGAALLVAELEAGPSSVAYVFGTQTTIDAGTYARILRERGIDPARIVSQACPGLADTISEDPAGERSKNEIAGWVQKALAKSPDPGAPAIAAMACTHYGYRKDQFAAAFAERGVDARVVNPNESAVADLFGAAPAPSDGNRDVPVRFITRYPIPPAAIEALTFYLEPVSPRTIEALRNYEHVPDLF
jgi:glutamate racemase